MFPKFFKFLTSVFEEDSTRNAIILGIAGLISIGILVWFFLFSGFTTESVPIYEGF